MKKRETVDLVIILLWPIIAAILSFLLKPKALGSVILFLAVPSIYLAYRGKNYLKKVFVFAITTSILTMIVLDYIAQITGAWLMYPHSILPFKFFGSVTLEVILWAFFTCFLIVIFYEYFLDKHLTKKLWNPKMKYLLMVSLIIFAIFVLFLFNLPSLLSVPYFYVSWGIVLLLIPFLLQLLKYPKTTSKFFLVAAYFFYMNFIYEITALKLGWWTFPGKQFVGWVSILGVSFPIEELFFWFILLALGILSYYEFFDDDEK